MYGVVYGVVYGVGCSCLGGPSLAHPVSASVLSKLTVSRVPRLAVCCAQDRRGDWTPYFDRVRVRACSWGVTFVVFPLLPIHPRAMLNPNVAAVATPNLRPKPPSPPPPTLPRPPPRPGSPWAFQSGSLPIYEIPRHPFEPFTLVTTLGQHGTGPLKFRLGEWSGLCFTCHRPEPTLLVADSGNDAVHEIDVLAMAHLEFVTTSLPQPTFVAASPSLIAVMAWTGRLYPTSRLRSPEQPAYVALYDARTMVLLRHLGASEALRRPRGLCISWDEGCVVVGDRDQSNKRLLRYSTTDGQRLEVRANALFDWMGWMGTGGLGEGTVVVVITSHSAVRSSCYCILPLPTHHTHSHTASLRHPPP